MMRLVCKDWNETFINSHDFWHSMMIANLDKGMKARGIEEKVEILSHPNRNNTQFMLNCIRNCFLAQQSIDCLKSVEA